MSSLCPSCHVDLYWQRSLENLRRAHEDRMELSRWQCQLIKRICAGRHAAPIEGVTP